MVRLMSSPRQHQSPPLVGLGDLDSWPSLNRALEPSHEGALLDALVAMAQGLQEIDVTALAKQVHLPVDEVGASPFGLRAVAMGAIAGARHVHRELTRVPALEGDSRTEDPRHDRWEQGQLQTGKYQAFIQEGAHSLFDPSHIAKWGPHELTHRACLFFWREDATPFELYLGARLGELLPVTLWYGLDQVARLDQEDFRRDQVVRHAPRAAWRDESASALRQRMVRSLPAFRRFFVHLRGELDAIARERATGRLHPRKWPFGGAVLDPSSDAIAYVAAHRQRLQQPELAAVMDSLPHYDDIDAYAAFVEDQALSLLSAPLMWADEEAGAGDAAGDLSRRAQRDRWHQEMAALMGGEECAAADGVHGLDYGQLAEGLEQCAPHTFDWLEAHHGDWLDDFVQSTEFLTRRPLAEGLRRFVSTHLKERPLTDLATFEAAVQRVRPSLRATELAATDGEQVIANPDYALLTFRSDVMALLAEQADTDAVNVTPGSYAVLTGPAGSEVVSMPVDQPLATLWPTLLTEGKAVEEVESIIGASITQGLLDAGALLYWDPPR